MNDNVACLLNLVRNSIDGIKTDIPSGYSEETQKLAAMHKIENFMYYAVNDPTQDMKAAYERALYIENYQAIYAQLIADEFEAHGIEHMFLKGSVIKYIYPYPEMRQSSDIDIWIEPDKAEEARSVMTELGFKTEHYGLSNHDEYRWNNIVYVELHKELVSDNYQWYEFCNGIVERRIKEDGYKYRYKMSDEDFYLFTLIHMAKHIKFGGAGIRLVLDVWVYLMKVRPDENDLCLKLEAAGMTRFDELIRELCAYWFEGKDTEDPVVLNLSLYMINSGWNGTAEQVRMVKVMRDSGKKHSKLHRYWGNIFWTRNKMMERYPVLDKHPYLLPFMWIHRAFCAVFVKKGTIGRVVHFYDDVEESSIKGYEKFINEIGLG